MRVLMLTEKVDRDDWLLGFTHRWVEALAAHPQVGGVDVLCLEAGEYDLPASVQVTSMGKEKGHGRLRELATAQRELAALTRRADAVLAHMVPRYALIAAPWAKLRGLPLVLWYTHRAASAELRLAHALVDRVVTASPESFTLPSRKLTVLGHGIDVAAFRPGGAPGGRTILAVGRLSPIKHYDALIQAVARLAGRTGYEDVRLAIAGGETEQHPGMMAALRALAAGFDIADRVELLGPVAPPDMPALYREAAVTANLCPTGGLDKVVIESFASGVPAVVRNDTFLPLLAEDAPLLHTPDLDPERVADRLAALLDQPAEARAALGARLADRVRESYSLDGLIDRLVGVFAAEIARRKGAAA